MSLQYLSPEKKKHGLMKISIFIIQSRREHNCRTCYLQLCLASDFYLETLVERAEDIHGAHVYMDSVS